MTAQTNSDSSSSSRSNRYCSRCSNHFRRKSNNRSRIIDHKTRLDWLKQAMSMSDPISTLPSSGMNLSMERIRESGKEVIDMAPAPTKITNVDERQKLSLDQLAIGVDGWMGCGWLRRGRGQETKQKQGLLCSPRAFFFRPFSSAKVSLLPKRCQTQSVDCGRVTTHVNTFKKWRLSILRFACSRALAHGLHTTGSVSHMHCSG